MGIPERLVYLVRIFDERWSAVWWTRPHANPLQGCCRPEARATLCGAVTKQPLGKLDLRRRPRADSGGHFPFCEEIL
jgi:hypothetical protein